MRIYKWSMFKDSFIIGTLMNTVVTDSVQWSYPSKRLSLPLGHSLGVLSDHGSKNSTSYIKSIVDYLRVTFLGVFFR